MVLVSYREVNLDYEKIYRVFISGSSGSGKTTFTKQFLNSKMINLSRVYYFHPDFHQTEPTDWQDSLKADVIFKPGIPSREFILQLKEHSCIVLDDVYDMCVDSKVIDELFRVLSGKHKIHVIVMTQRYFFQGKYSLSIRNSSNTHVLMRNVDSGEIRRISQTLGLVNEVKAATAFNSNIIYPYIFIDCSNLARAYSIVVYIDILSKRKVFLHGSMKYYILTESDFKACFTKKDNELAEHRSQIIDHDARRKERQKFDRKVKRAVYKLTKTSKL